MKTTPGVLKEIQGGGTTDAAILTASRRLRPELKADEDTPGFSKRLQQEQELKEVAQDVSERLHRLLQFKEVARDDSEGQAGSGSPGRASRTDDVTVTVT